MSTMILTMVPFFIALSVQEFVDGSDFVLVVGVSLDDLLVRRQSASAIQVFLGVLVRWQTIGTLDIGTVGRRG